MDTPEFSEYQPKTSTPADFPRRSECAALSGAVTKFSARVLDGKYFVGASEEEHRERYLDCCSLLSDLIYYSRRKQKTDVLWTAEALQQRVKLGLESSPELELTQSELWWILQQLSTHMQWPAMKR